MTDLAVSLTPDQSHPKIDKRKSGIDITKILNLRDVHGLSFADIGRQMGTTRHAINYAYKQFTRLFPDYQQTEIYKDNKISYMTQAESILLQDMVSVERRKNASLNNTAYAWDKIFNNNRQERGLATAGGVTVNIEIAYQEATDRSKALRLKHVGSGVLESVSSKAAEPEG